MGPVRLTLYVPGASLACYCQEGTFYHVWWTCPKIERFWICIYNFIFCLTQINLRKSILQAFLNKPVKEVSIHSKK